MKYFANLSIQLKLSKNSDLNSMDMNGFIKLKNSNENRHTLIYLFIFLFILAIYSNECKTKNFSTCMSFFITVLQM